MLYPTANCSSLSSSSSASSASSTHPLIPAQLLLVRVSEPEDRMPKPNDLGGVANSADTGSVGGAPIHRSCACAREKKGQKSGQKLDSLSSKWEMTSGKLLRCNGFGGGQGRGRTADLPIFSRTLVPTELPGRGARSA